MDFGSYRGITLILIGRSAIQLICVYDVYLGVPFHSIAKKSPLLKECLNCLIHTKQITSSSLALQLKLKCLLKKPTHDDIIEAKEVYNQQSFERYKGKLVLRN